MSYATEYERDEEVIVGTDANLQSILDSNDKILVEFYAPWCGHCKKLAPEYAAAAAELKKEDINIVKVDATENSEVAKKYGVQGYPTLKWFVNGEPTDYTGGRTKDDIIQWIKKRSGPPSTSVTPADLESKIGSAKVVVVFFGAEGTDEFKAFESAASKDDKRTFFHTEASAASTHGAGENGVVLFRTFDEPKVVFDGELSNLNTWIEAQSVPTLIEFSDEYIEPIFQKQQPAIFLFRDENSEEQKALVDTFEKAAQEGKGQILFSVSGTTNGIQQRLAEFVGVTGADTPAIMLIEFAQSGVSKFKFTGDSAKFTSEEVLGFVKAWKDGKLEKYLKSEEVPETNDEPVKVVVGKNFNDIVRDSDDDVLLEYYAPWCGHCKALAPKYDELAKDLADCEGLVIAKVDATANEIEGANVSGFPTIYFYAKGSKRAPQTYDGEREVDGFKKWLAENSAAYKKCQEKNSDL